MATVGEYFQTWKLKLNTTKTVSAASILTTGKLNVSLKSNTTTKPCSSALSPNTLDRSLMYRRHLESLRKQLTSRVALLRRLAGRGWGAGATTLRTATLALVHSTPEYCAPVWCRSAYTRLIDPAINDALRIVTGCLRPTSNRDTHLYSLHNNTSVYLTTTIYVAAQWADHQWKAEWTIPQDSTFSSPTSVPPPGMTLPRRAWVRLNRLRHLLLVQMVYGLCGL